MRRTWLRLNAVFGPLKLTDFSGEFVSSTSYLLYLSYHSRRMYSRRRVVGRSVASVCLCLFVCALKGKWLELSAPKFMAGPQHALALRSKGQRSNPNPNPRFSFLTLTTIKNPFIHYSLTACLRGHYTTTFTTACSLHSCRI